MSVSKLCLISLVLLSVLLANVNGGRKDRKTTQAPKPAPTCSDKKKNGGETGVDCGGKCIACVLHVCKLCKNEAICNEGTKGKCQCQPGWQGPTCTEYKPVWGPTKVFTQGARCGSSVKADCSPEGKFPCCSSKTNGKCGADDQHCKCANCKDFSTYKAGQDECLSGKNKCDTLTTDCLNERNQHGISTNYMCACKDKTKVTTFDENTGKYVCGSHVNKGCLHGRFEDGNGMGDMGGLKKSIGKVDTSVLCLSKCFERRTSHGEISINGVSYGPDQECYCDHNMNKRQPTKGVASSYFYCAKTCETDNFDYKGEALPNGIIDNIIDWQTCSILCKKEPKCKVWVWAKNWAKGREDCYLKAVTFTDRKDVAGKISGTRECFAVHGGWSEWKATKCSKPCGPPYGIIHKTRQCNNPSPANGADCVGQSRESFYCNQKRCPIHGGWSIWLPYSTCTKKCGGGTKNRTRACINPRPWYGGDQCKGINEQEETCNEQFCAINGGWGAWTRFSDCTENCGGGKTTRTRTCSNPAPLHGGSKCPGSNTQTDDCNKHNCPINGNWAQWTRHGKCSKDCAGGRKMRTRECNNPAPQYEGKTCEGEGSQSDECNSHKCPIHGNWGEFDRFDKCTADCGGGNQSRTRECNNPAPKYSGKQCEGSPEESQPCNEHLCPINGAWGTWTSFNTCSLKCGEGTYTRTRLCNKPKPQHQGNECPGEAKHTQTCNAHKCPIHGNWGVWTEGQCSQNCGTGTKIFTRVCDNPAPKYKGNPCANSGTKNENCNIHPCPINGGWSEWGTHLDCTKECGGGTHTRKRTCTAPKPKHGGKICPGNPSETTECNAHDCPIDGQWGKWEEFDKCTKDCGSGEKTRTRKCDNPTPQFQGKPCPPASGTNTVACNTHNCPINGKWGEWKEYGKCAVECGGGFKKRTRVCDSPPARYGGAECKGSGEESDDCNSHKCPIDGKWGKYSEWSKCSEDCDGGKQRATRKCDNPKPQYEGKDCGDDDSITQECNTHNCPINGGWGSWKPYSTCTMKCGGGMKKRTRECTNPTPQYDGEACKGLDNENTNCNVHNCPINGLWGEWTESGKCSLSCGRGEKEFSRSCNNPEPKYKGLGCAGDDTKSVPCNPDPCPINGNWGQWNKYGKCTETCGGGEMTRSRTCNDPAPKFGGEQCPGTNQQTTECNIHNCPINGGLGQWTKFGPCTLECGGGKKTQTRKCDNPLPQFGGNKCNGTTINVVACNIHNCPVDGNWAQWTKHGNCDADCGGGEKMRSRECNNPAPDYGGKQCQGAGKERDECNKHECPINGTWGKFSEWGKCTKECGKGSQTQLRKCDNPKPQFGGNSCVGEGIKKRECNTHYCPIDGGWGIWDPYSTCTKKCGGGTKTRYRKCNKPEPQYKGEICPGLDVENVECNLHMCPIDGQWGGWTASSCTVTCGGGSKILTRVCNNPVAKYLGKPCDGNATKTETCNKNPCPIDGGWTTWTDYTTCSVKCGTGTQSHSRTCTQPEPEHGGTQCRGLSNDKRNCNTHECPIDGKYGEYSEFGACTKSCGGGRKTQTRKCDSPAPKYKGKECEEESTNTENCNMHHCPINGNWGEWKEYGNCAVECGGGLKKRTRVCDSPPARYGGAECKGSGEESDDCNSHKCPIDGKWGKFSEWGKCSVDCAGGTQIATRECDNPAPKFQGKTCSGNSTTSRDCNTHDCPIDGGWGRFTEFDQCTLKCDGGEKTRTRLCNNPEPQYGGRTCEGKGSNTAACNTHPCPIDGGWGEYVISGKCSAECGGGEIELTRKCTHPAPKHSGKQCSGKSTKKEFCNPKPCPIDGNWGKWAAFDDCTQECGGGTKARTRVCDDPAPKHGGAACLGSPVQKTECNIHFCPIDGKWGPYSTFGACTAECGKGTKTQTRQCNNPEPKHGGAECKGEADNTVICNTHPCPIDGDWSQWTTYGTCNLPCGTGSKMRTRKCNTPAPEHEGKECEGDAKESDKCNTHNCPINGEWGTWSQFVKCSKECGEGTQQQTRKCNNPAPKYKGTPCDGANTNPRPCNIHKCPINGIWGTWTEFTQCTVKCGFGIHTRTRECDKPKPQHQGKTCEGYGRDTKFCNKHECPIDGEWGEWQIGDCTAKCGGGKKTLVRVCNNPDPQNNGKKCPGDATLALDCNKHPCPVAGGWTKWTDYTTCTQDCGGGTKTRVRTCSSPAPLYSGAYCPGESEETTRCNEHSCPIHGQWGAFSVFGSCSMSCGGGNRIQTRACNNPSPKHGGNKCAGSADNSEKCNTQNCPIDGGWGVWSAHGDCNAKCNGGIKTRTRKCNKPSPAHGGDQCPGSATETDGCNKHKCPIDGGWGQFSKFTKCTLDCGNGTRTQTRTCDNPVPQNGGAPCKGSVTNSQYCNHQPCPINGGWGSYSKFDACTVKCGGGTRTQTRLCNNPEPQHRGSDCEGPESKTEECNKHNCPIHGGWSKWATNGVCSKQCGNGVKRYTRVCDNLKPMFGGINCAGLSSKTESCNTNPCPIDGKWSDWGVFSKCTSDCGGGHRVRLRVCNNPAPQYGGKRCEGLFEQKETCNEQFCAINGAWGAWSTFGDCSAQCGGGKKTKSRGCSFPPPQHGGKPCSGISTIREDCNKQACPVNGEWGEWSAHGTCTVDCGGGRKTRERKCDKPAPAHGGKHCVGTPKEVDDCNSHKCPIHGGWGEYSTFGQCSATCGGGVQTQSRVCNNPAPNFGGKKCEGSDINRQECNKQLCPVNGGFGSWSRYTACTKDCGGGFQSRVRECNNPAPKLGGKPCEGTSQMTRNCNEKSCPINGGWGEFKPVGKCTVSCGGGIQVLKRICDNPKPQHNGNHCTGSDSKTINCGEKDCPVDGGWGPWTEFGRCSLECGGGAQTRTRVCNDQMALNGGKACEGSTVNSRKCNLRECPVDGLWGEWKPYSTCANGLQTRHRSCDNPPPKFNGAFCVGDASETDVCQKAKSTVEPDVKPKPGHSTKKPYIDDCDKEDFLKCWNLNKRIVKMGCYNQTELKDIFHQDMKLLHDDKETGNIGNWKTENGEKRIWKCFGNYLHNLVCDCEKRAKESGFRLFSIAQYGKCYASNDVGALFRAGHTHRKTGNECFQADAAYKECYINTDGNRDGCGSKQFKNCSVEAMGKSGEMFGECQGSAGFEFIYAIK